MKAKIILPRQCRSQIPWMHPWMFLTPSQGEPNTITFKVGLYRPRDVTPYMHVLIHHLSKFMEQHQRFGLNAFSCSPVEKKNHEHVRNYYYYYLKIIL